MPVFILMVHSGVTSKLVNCCKGGREVSAKCLLGLVALLCLLAGCVQVAPWQRGQLAHDNMAFQPDPQEYQIRNHTYTSKEAATGGATIGGGGCGCN